MGLVVILLMALFCSSCLLSKRCSLACRNVDKAGKINQVETIEVEITG